MSNIVDLDAILPTDKVVRFGERDWKVPGDMPMEIFVSMQQIAQEDDNEESEQNAREAYDQLVELMMQLFTYKVSPEDTESRQFLEGLLRNLGVRAFFALFRHIYGADAAEEPGDDEAGKGEIPSPEVEDGQTKTNSELPTEEPTPSPEKEEPAATTAATGS